MDPWKTEPDGGALLLESVPLIPGETVKCGNRRDLPRKQRRHTWIALGLDVRNCGEAGFLECEISACVICGADKKVTASGQS